MHVPHHILFEDEFIIVLNKPHGLMVEPDRNGHPNLLHLVRKYLQQSSGGGLVYAQHIHRLDRPVSGIILFAKQRSVLKNLSDQFAERRVKKYYQALTANSAQFSTGKIENWHRKEKKKAMIYDAEVEFSEKAHLDYFLEALPDHRFLWNIELHTGKYHQIRAQLAHLGCPIIGDSFYGSTNVFKPDAIALHASKLIFTHPVLNKELIMATENDFA